MADPPFEGTIFIDPDIITASDPTLFLNVVYAGQGMRTMFDRRVNSFITVNAYLFNASFGDGLTAEIQVNPEFGSSAAALVEAQKYGDVIGRLPTVLRTDVKTVWIHKGIEPFGGGNHNILIHTGQTDLYVADGILEETLVHEAAHTSLDATHASAPNWLTAQTADGTFISTYARDNPTREDIAESFLPYLAVRYKSDRISQSLANTILQAIPNRIAYFDNQSFNMYPAPTFADVPASHPQYKYIEALYKVGLTSGCSTNPLKFCPDLILDRAQSSVFMVRGQLGATFTPPPAPWPTFVLDNWVGYEYAQAWAEAMYQAGLTTGCQQSPLKYCPEQKLSRVQASILGLRMKNGVAYVPPAATGTVFTDYPATDPSYSWGIAWAEQAYKDGLLPACGTDPVSSKPMFCPNEQVNRGWAAYLIVKAKGIPTP